ncbi:MAG TPA: DUF5134 domain-containing protein [Streptosporangiaceae bacterium]|nr:DUF5134 domain-containing protein [Streptosporangiaceae bacterium]
MTGPFWLAGVLAALMIATAAYCATRLIIARVHRRPDERDVDLVHTVMGVAMAGMLVSWLNPLPNPVWAVMFSAGTAWFGWRAWHDRRSRAVRDAAATRPTGRASQPHHVPHLVMCGAMVYMLLAVGAVTSATHPGTIMGSPATVGRFPLLALILAVFMVAYVMWQADRLPALARVNSARPAPAPALALASVPSAGGQAMQAYEATLDPPSGQRRWGMLSRRLVGRDNMPPPLAHRLMSPRLAACCQIAMAVTMGYMLILML